MTRCIACLLLLAVSACANGRATDDWCVTNQPMRPTSADVTTMSDRSVASMLAHNAYGAKHCGWKP